MVSIIRCNHFQVMGTEEKRMQVFVIYITSVLQFISDLLLDALRNSSVDGQQKLCRKDFKKTYLFQLSEFEKKFEI